MKILINTRGLIVLLLPLLFNLACNNASFYSKSIDLEGSWNRADTAGFCVNVEDTGQPYNFYVDIRNNQDYRYSNLYIFMHTSFPNGNTMHDTIEFILAKKDGEWIGRGMGSVKENNILVRPGLVFPVAGEYCFRLEQAMRVEDLQGIEDIGIRIEKAEAR
ncbi:MAG: gliding motility lipoprotein GldH [Bacteroidota bacterium]|nr:gliding motility lipoprotein GldH [Bacteroidota bacterium]